MNIPRLFKLPEHKTFTYRPLYHDPEKEEREARLRAIKAESGMAEEGKYSSNIYHGAMKSYFKRGATAKKESNLRLVLIIAFLLFITYLLLFR